MFVQRMRLLKKYFFGATLFVAFFGVGVSLNHALAGNGQNTIGWLWGGGESFDSNGIGTPPNNGIPPLYAGPFDGDENGLGWVSMNSRDCDTNGSGIVDAADAAPAGCPLGVIYEYGVNTPLTDGILTGHAWSGGRTVAEPGYGWISFNAADVAGCPTSPCSARRKNNALEGWARILSIRDAGTNSGGWNGFVSLSSKTDGSSEPYPYGVSIDPNTLVMSGYVWSSGVTTNELGWINFGSPFPATISPAAVFQLCRDTGTSPIATSGQTWPANFSVGDSASMKTYFDNTLDCQGTNVTSLTTFTDTPSLAIVLSGTNPKVVTAQTFPLALGAGQQSENDPVVATYNGQTITMDITVHEVCYSTCSSVAPNHCKGESFPATNTCSAAETCTGTRNCNYNWIETAP